MFTDAGSEEPVGRLIPATVLGPEIGAPGRAAAAAPLGEGSKRILTFPRSTGSTDGCMFGSPTGKIIRETFFAAALKPPASRWPRGSRAFGKARVRARNDRVLFSQPAENRIVPARPRGRTLGCLGDQDTMNTLEPARQAVKSSESILASKGPSPFSTWKALCWLSRICRRRPMAPRKDARSTRSCLLLVSANMGRSITPSLSSFRRDQGKARSAPLPLGAGAALSKASLARLPYL
jgi:hypothetical protein